MLLCVSGARDASVRPMMCSWQQAAGSSCGDWPWPVVSLPTDSVVLCRTHAFGSAHGPRAARFVDLEQAHGTLSFGEPAPGCSTCRRRWEGREGGLGRNKIKCKESVRGQLGQRLARSYSIVAQSSVCAIRHGRLVVITVVKKLVATGFCA